LACAGNWTLKAGCLVGCGGGGGGGRMLAMAKDLRWSAACRVWWHASVIVLVFCIVNVAALKQRNVVAVSCQGAVLLRVWCRPVAFGSSDGAQSSCKGERSSCEGEQSEHAETPLLSPAKKVTND
jgi:hypothetical protein